jgi:hypothetical protein
METIDMVRFKVRETREVDFDCDPENVDPISLGREILGGGPKPELATIYGPYYEIVEQMYVVRGDG